MFIDKSIDELIGVFEDNLLDTNRGYNYYIDWSNIGGLDSYIVELCAMDALIGKQENFDIIFLNLLDKVPSVIKIFPFLFALSKAEREIVINRRRMLKILGTEIDSDDAQNISFFHSTGTAINEEQKNEYLRFFEQMGLKNLYQNIIKKSTYDYVIGVLVGLDTNGRKNRGGKAFELACEPMIRTVCENYDIAVITQKQFKILRSYGFDISEDIENRKADFILLKGEKCLNIEVNFFNGTGSKPEEIIDSYINRQTDLKNNGIDFALVTDGNCWNGTTNQLNKGFRHLDYLMNYGMMKGGMLEEIIKEVFV